MRIKSWFEFVKTVQEIAKAVPKNELHNDSFWVACKEKLCSLSCAIPKFFAKSSTGRFISAIIYEYKYKII